MATPPTMTLPPNPIATLGFIGLGVMGEPVRGHLARTREAAAIDGAVVPENWTGDYARFATIVYARQARGRRT